MQDALFGAEVEFGVTGAVDAPLAAAMVKTEIFDGYRYGGKDFDRRGTLTELEAAMPSLERTIVLPYLDPEPDLSALREPMRWEALLASVSRRPPPARRHGRRAGPSPRRRACRRSACRWASPKGKSRSTR